MVGEGERGENGNTIHSLEKGEHNNGLHSGTGRGRSDAQWYCQEEEGSRHRSPILGRMFGTQIFCTGEWMRCYAFILQKYFCRVECMQRYRERKNVVHLVVI